LAIQRGRRKIPRWLCSGDAKAFSENHIARCA
jgi:hypothetical protein